MLSQENIKQFIVDEIRADIEAEDLDNDLDLIGLNVINSLSVLKLVLFFEKENDISIDLEEIDFSSFKSINSMHQYISEKYLEESV